MKKPSEDSSYYQDWVKKAERDLSTAVLNFAHGGYTDVSCYFAHQTVEKILKAFLLFRGVPRLPMIHILPALLSECEKLDASFSGLVDEVEVLGSYYVEAKYPVLPAVDYSKDETEKAIEAAEKVLNFVKEKISER